MSTEPLFPTLEDEIARQVLTLRNNIYNLLKQVGDEDCCDGKDCRARIFFVKHKSGFTQVYDLDAKPHWASCPNANDFKKKRRPHA